MVSMESILQIAGTFGVPTALLAALIYWVLIPLGRAHIVNLNKVGDALPPIADAMKTISQNQIAAADALKIAAAEAVKTATADALNRAAPTMCKWIPPRDQ